MTYPLLPIRSVLLLGASALSLALSSEAHACSGLEPVEQLTIPNSVSEPVSLGTLPLVIGGTSLLTLRSIDGTNVPIAVVDLGQVQRPAVFPGSSPHWQPYTVRRIEPTERLEPSTEYIVSASGQSLGGSDNVGGGSEDAGVGGMGELGRFVTVADEAPGVEPVVPSELALRFYSFGQGNSASCSGSGQLEVDGWQDNTLLELCVEYFTYTEYIDPAFGEGDSFDDRPARRNSCWLAWRPSAHVLEEMQPVLWVESVTVRALGLGGNVSPTVVFERGDLDQFDATEGVDGLAAEPFTPLEFPSSDSNAPVGEEEEEEPGEGSGDEFIPSQPVSETGTGTSSAGAQRDTTSGVPSSSARNGCSVSATKRSPFQAGFLFVLVVGAMRRRRRP